MKTCGFFLILFTIMLSLSVNAFGQNTAKSVDVYDAEMSRQVGADDHGMKQYIFAILRVGKAKRPEGKEMEALQAGHMKNIMKLDEEGKLSLAGPFMDGGEMRGLFIFNVKTVEEARKLVESDPLISGGYLEAEFHPWYGSAALTEVTRLHKKIQKKKIM
ncbi:MAG TPA: YciI family protein [Pyrinomonadaceae bacterium]|nr:YciI family protein [Pyrinomonadaceae bacterium]